MCILQHLTHYRGSCLFTFLYRKTFLPPKWQPPPSPFHPFCTLSVTTGNIVKAGNCTNFGLKKWALPWHFITIGCWESYSIWAGGMRIRVNLSVKGAFMQVLCSWVCLSEVIKVLDASVASVPNLAQSYTQNSYTQVYKHCFKLCSVMLLSCSPLWIQPH